MVAYPTKSTPKALALGPLIGSVGLLMMSIYPLHMAFGGDEWLVKGFFYPDKEEL